MHDRDIEKALMLNGVARNSGGSGIMCRNRSCTHGCNRTYKWYYSYYVDLPSWVSDKEKTYEETRPTADERAWADGWRAIYYPPDVFEPTARDDGTWPQVCGWFCSPECLASPDADVARRQVEESAARNTRPWWKFWEKKRKS